jgi:cellulose synthase/poly-beta-1,6-N-acetylglucosamine synthase-like glycosyltransferase
LDDFNKIEKVHTIESIKFKSKVGAKTNGRNRPNTYISDKHIKAIALFFSILITVSISLFIHAEVTIVTKLIGHETIVDEPELLHSLQTAQASGVIVAIHGWEHENYSEITPNQALVYLEKSKAVFEEAELKSGYFISPYEILGAPQKTEVSEAMKSEGFEVGTIGHPINEYTWLWRNMTSFDDPRSQAASIQIRNEKPKIIVFHAQDWNKYTEQFLVSYLTSTDDKVILRMDDISVNTPKEVINGAAKLAQYASVSEVIFAVIPSGVRDVNNPVVFNTKINDIMKIYFVFFILTSLLPMSFFVSWKLLSGWNMRKYLDGQQTAKSAGYPDLVSVISPAYNEEKSIGRCIEALLSQDYKGAMEIIIVNDGSIDRTAEIISTYPVKLIDLKKNAGKSNALNRGIEEAKGDILVFTDSDSNMAKDAISCLVKALMDDSDAQMVTGNVLINTPTKISVMGRIMIYFQMIEYHLEQEIARYLQGLSGKIVVCPGPATAVRRSVCEILKFSDDTVVEDADFTVNALERSIKIIRSPQAKVYTNAPVTLPAWYKQRKRWWYGCLQVWRIHRRWAVRNMWMIYNYMGYITSITSIILILFVPYFLLQYNDVALVAMSGLLYYMIPILLYILFMGWFFRHDKKLVPMLIPFFIFYATLRALVISYVYICYLTGRGLKIKFGSQTINAK